MRNRLRVLLKLFKVVNIAYPLAYRKLALVFHSKQSMLRVLEPRHSWGDDLLIWLIERNNGQSNARKYFGNFLIAPFEKV